MKLSKEFWNNLSEKAQWDIKTALRGPDCFHSEHIKFWTTGVIRYACRDAFRVGGSQNDKISFVLAPSGALTGMIQPEHIPFGWNWTHFAQHVRDAAEYMNIPVVMVKSDLYLQAVNTSPSQFANTLLNGGIKKAPNGLSMEDLTHELSLIMPKYL